MRARSIPYIIPLILFFVTSFLSTNKLKAETVVVASEKIAFTHTTSSLPSEELELVKQEVTSAGHCTIYKKIALVENGQASTVYPGRTSLENLVIKRSLLFVKNYLFQIHPYHFFW